MVLLAQLRQAPADTYPVLDAQPVGLEECYMLQDTGTRFELRGRVLAVYPRLDRMELALIRGSRECGLVKLVWREPAAVRLSLCNTLLDHELDDVEAGVHCFCDRVFDLYSHI